MRQTARLLAVILFTSLVTAAATAALTAPQPPQTRVEAEGDSIRFIVNGTEQARIDKNGLHVRQGVQYGGGLLDTGEAFYDHQFKQGPKH